MKKPLLEVTKNGLYCAEGKFYIDPWGKVDRAVVTHAHSDHARPGAASYLAHKQSETVLRLRLGRSTAGAGVVSGSGAGDTRVAGVTGVAGNISASKALAVEAVDYNQPVTINGVEVTLFPAGHIPGSAQVRIRYGGETWVVSGDYKTEDDGLSRAFEPVNCDHFISEATFALPVFKWRAQKEVFSEIEDWWRENQGAGRTSIIFSYTLGKAQRLLAGLDRKIGPIVGHGSIINTTNALIIDGVKVSNAIPVSDLAKEDLSKALVLAPSSSQNSSWLNRFYPYSLATASGWMQLRGARRWQALDRGFVLSDHADWPGLQSAVLATKAENVYITHGYSSIFAKWLKEKYKLNAVELQTLFSTSGEEQENG